MEGQIFSHYQVLERLGGGGMGVVYKALDTTLDRHVALKFLPPELTRDDEARRRFMQEAKAASALDHPNVCAVHEIASTPDDQLFIAMGYYAGETLKQRIGRGALAVGDALDIIRQVAEGLAEAHAAGIVHRDIKPANIIVTTSGLVKILDFGIAKLTGVTGLTETGITLGTVSYMSPEQVNGEDAGPQSDVWALGAVLYELLTEQTPFPGDRPAVVMHAITDRAPTPLRTQCPEASPDVVRLVTRALEKPRELRYRTAREFLAAVPIGSTRAWTSAGATRPTERTVGPKPASREDPSIAVLPFADMSPERDQDYFCEGMAEEIINALTAVDGLQVASRTSAFQAKARDFDMAEIGARLQVGAVLEGSVRKAGNRLRVTAQLINVSDGYHLWSARYDREMDDVFAVQDEIARAVVDKLRVKLMGGAQRRFVERPTQSLDAYRCYLQGRHNRLTRYNAAKAGQFYEEAVRHDPGYAAAWAGVADAAVMAGNNLQQPPGAVAARAREAVDRALTLDSSLSEAHTVLGKIRLYFDWQWDDAEPEFTRAIELNPANVDAHTGYGSYLAWMGRTEEALTQLTKAQELDPLSAHAAALTGIALHVGRRYEEATAACRQALELQPDMTLALWHLGNICSSRSQHEEALAYRRRVPEAIARSPLHLCGLIPALARVGKDAEAKRLLSELTDGRQRQYVSPFAYASIYGGLGDLDEALNQLEKAYEERSPGFVYLLLPHWDPIRDHPRGQDLVRRLNLPDPRLGAARAESLT